MQETQVQSLGLEDPLEKEMATQSSILAWRIPWTEKPGGLQSMGSQSQTWLSDQHFHVSLHSHPTGRVSHLITHYSSVGNCIPSPQQNPSHPKALNGPWGSERAWKFTPRTAATNEPDWFILSQTLIYECAHSLLDTTRKVLEPNTFC